MASKIKKISLRDIADAAGVSTALVSFVLNGQGRKRRVNEDTAKRILRIAKELNYQPNIAARTLRSGKTDTIGVVLSDISNLFFSQIARSIEDIAMKYGYTVLFGSSDEDATKLRRLVESLINRGVDGLIVVPCENSETLIESIIDKEIPLVLFDRHFPRLSTNYVVLDNFSATYKATNHLLESGFESPGIVAYELDLSHMKDRVEGYKSAMKDSGLADKINVSYIKPSTLSQCEIGTVKSMLDKKVDSLIFATNTISLSCLYSIKELGVKVPEDIGLVGYDGSSGFDFFHSPLTYISQPVELLAKKAIDLLKEDMTNDYKTSQAVLLEGQLIARESTKKR